MIENQRLHQLVNIWNKSSVSLRKMHEVKKQIGDKTNLVFINYYCNLFETNTQFSLDKKKIQIDEFC